MTSKFKKIIAGEKMDKMAAKIEWIVVSCEYQLKFGECGQCNCDVAEGLTVVAGSPISIFDMKYGLVNFFQSSDPAKGIFDLNS